MSDRDLPNPAANQHLRFIETPRPPDRWEYDWCHGTKLDDADAMGAKGWEAFAVTRSNSCDWVIWMKRRLP